MGARQLGAKTALLLTAGALLVGLCLALVVDRPPPEGGAGDRFPNPLWDEYQLIARQHDLDLSFTAEVWKDRKVVDWRRSPLFEREPGSLDVLFLGDSTMTWGFIPSVVEQITGLEVFLWEAGTMSVANAEIFRRIVDLYLKPDGLVVLSFANWTMDKGPNATRWNREARRVFKRMSDVQLADFARRRREAVEKGPVTSFEGFRKRREELESSIADRYGLRLPSLPLYSRWIGPTLSPEFERRQVTYNSRGRAPIRWDLLTTTMVTERIEGRSIHSETSDARPTRSKAVRRNARAFRTIRHRKVFMIPLYGADAHYRQARRLYTSILADDFELIDLGREHPKEGGFPMLKDGIHPANEGGLQKSILIAQALEKLLAHR